MKKPSVALLLIAVGIMWCSTQVTGQNTLQRASQTSEQQNQPQARLGFTPVDTIRISQTRFGGYARAILQQHSINFGGFSAPLDNSVSLGTFALNGGTTSGEAGVLAEFPIVGGLGVGVRFGAMLFAPRFAYTLPTSVGPLDVPAQYTITALTNIFALAAEPMLSYRLFDRLSLYLGVTPVLLLGKTFVQERNIELIATAPDPFTVSLTETVRKNIQSTVTGTLESTLVPMASIGASWEFPLDKYGKTMIAPEILYSLALGDMTTGLFAQQGSTPSWRMSALRLGASLRFSPERTVGLLPEEMEEQYRNYEDSLRKAQQRKDDSIKVVLKDVVRASFADVVGISRDGRTITNPKIRVEEFLASKSKHLVNFVFFSEGSSVLPIRYKRLQANERINFRFEYLAENSTLQTYYQILNIVGKRLTGIPGAKLTLTGYIDGMSEKGNTALGLQRAESIKEYLTAVWKIDEKRILTKFGGTRIRQENDTLEAEESRCVEMQASIPEVLEELRFDYTMRLIEPPKLRITPIIFAEAGLKQWLFEATQIVGSEVRTLKALEGQSLPSFIELDLQNAPEAEQPASEDVVSLELKATDAKGYYSNAPLVAIDVDIQSVEKKRKMGKRDERVDTYVVFAFTIGTNTIMAEDASVQRVVKAIAQTLKPGAKVEIIGYTDTRGSVEGNKKLSEERASSVAKLINFADATVTGAGITSLNDNRTPEGRFYNRFVRVEVRTPIR